MPGPFQIQGDAMSVYKLGALAQPENASILTSEKSDGANYVAIGNFTAIDLATGKTNDAINRTFGIDQTESLANVVAAIQAAQAKGLSVLLKPQIGTSDGFGGINNLFSGAITNPDAFFAGYKAFILGYAQIAEQNHVAILSIGNEMAIATGSQYTSYWLDIIASVRQIYHGQLTYSASLGTNPSISDPSNFTNEAGNIGFWSKLDFAGLDVYPSLTTKADPSVAELDAAWHNAFVFGNQTRVDYAGSIASIATKIGIPVLFTETGTASFSGSNDRNDHPDGTIGSGQTDFGEQVRWHEAFFETWGATPPSWLKGVFFWNNDADSGFTPTDVFYAQGYQIDGKPAEYIDAAWFSGAMKSGAQYTEGDTTSTSSVMFIKDGAQLAYSGNTGHQIIAGIGNDTLVGGSGSDTIFATGGGNDVIVGGNGQGQTSFLIGGSGRDTLVAGQGITVMLGQTVAPLHAAPAAEVALIDPAYYLTHNADVADAAADPFSHYVQSGVHEGRNPDALFDTNYYLAHNPDVAASGVDPLLHYAAFGWKEGRDPSASFSTKGYLAANRDVAAAGINPLQHYLQFGMSEHRPVAPGVTGNPAILNTDAVSLTPDVGTTFVVPLSAGPEVVVYGFQQGTDKLVMTSLPNSTVQITNATAQAVQQLNVGGSSFLYEGADTNHVDHWVIVVGVARINASDISFV